MRKSFKDSLKALEADIQHANTLASNYPKEYDGACLQMRLSYSPCAHIFLFLVQWTDCNLAGALGLIMILIYKAYEDGKTTMSLHERKASLREFYGAKKGKSSEIEIEREEECGICMEMDTKVILPNCNHSLCMKCYRTW
ncbi:hypothetical protein ACJIZ3_011301 [Penstemon smallii]|uniref:RING-type domain-containing protein n=1 Tax=Penstemon smallii TaxID=265156 RepID=A0ABD3UIR4_9LAMI